MTDETVVKGCEIARKCKELLIRDRLEMVLDDLKQELF
jgi:hypothetical protein